MSQNRGSEESFNTSTNTAGGAATGATDAGTTRDTLGTSMTRGSQSTGGTGTAAAPAQGLTAQAQEYGQKIAEAATQARDYVTDKVSVVGDRIKDLQNKDFSQVTEEAREYARQKPGQALLISAAAGFVIGLLLRGTRR